MPCPRVMISHNAGKIITEGTLMTFQSIVMINPAQQDLIKPHIIDNICLVLFCELFFKCYIILCSYYRICEFSAPSYCVLLAFIVLKPVFRVKPAQINCKLQNRDYCWPRANSFYYADVWIFYRSSWFIILIESERSIDKYKIIVGEEICQKFGKFIFINCGARWNPSTFNSITGT